ncbi:putative Collagen alpha-2(IV) chain-like 3, partial [Homarus americanus]
GPLEAEVRDGGKTLPGSEDPESDVEAPNGVNESIFSSTPVSTSLLMTALGVGSGFVLLVILLLLLFFFTFRRRRRCRRTPQERSITRAGSPPEGVVVERRSSQSSSPRCSRPGDSPVLTRGHHTTCLKELPVFSQQVEVESDANPDVIPVRETCLGCRREPPPARPTPQPSPQYRSGERGTPPGRAAPQFSAQYRETPPGGATPPQVFQQCRGCERSAPHYREGTPGATTPQLSRHYREVSPGIPAPQLSHQYREGTPGPPTPQLSHKYREGTPGAATPQLSRNYREVTPGNTAPQSSHRYHQYAQGPTHLPTIRGAVAIPPHYTASNLHLFCVSSYLSTSSSPSLMVETKEGPHLSLMACLYHRSDGELFGKKAKEKIES